MQGGWDNNYDALQMDILFFIHTFLYSQLGDAPIPIEDFFMVEDGSYEQYPWGQVAFTKLMKSFRQEYTPTKKMYRLNGLSYALNVWIYECASVLNNEIAVKEGNGIPRMCNWQVVAPKPKFEMFMDTIFTEIDCSNIQPTPEEIRSLDLPDNNHVPSTRPDSPIVNNEEVQPEEVPGFEDFSSKPPDQLLRRSTRVLSSGSTPPRKRIKVVHPHKYNLSHLTQPHEQPKQSFQSPSSEPKQVDNVSSVPHNTFPGRTTFDSAGMEDLKMYMKGYDDGADTIQQEFEKHASNSAVVNTSDSTTSASISSGTELAVDALVYRLPNQPINVKPLSVLHLTENDDFLSDSQIPTQLPGDEPAPNTNIKTPAHRNRMPSKVLQSPYVNSFGSSDKGNETIDDDIRPYTPFEDCRITYQLSSGLMQEFLEWIQKGLLRTHVNKKPFEDKYRGKSALFGFDHMDFVVACPADKNWFYTMSYPMKCWTDQEHIDRGVTVSAYERSIKDIISGFSIPATLPWHLVDEVYIPINCGEDFHWVLAVVVLKERLIRVYDSSMRSRKKVYAEEIKKLSVMLPNYLHDSGFFDKTGRTDWASMEAYKDKENGELLGPQQSFEVEYAQDIMQQQSDSLDCGMYVADFAEYLSDEISIPSISFRSDYLRNRYAILLWKYGVDKFKAGYVSDNDDPTRPKSFYTIPAEGGLINIE
uniref:Ulp1 protease family, C-terminal catalytic domain containing protein n=1 Tax=Solanum tuberosum TaxID=4113 RepID=M1CLN1_SOLTU